MAWNILEGDVIEVLKTLHPQQFNTVVTSPPYWGLRDYGTATWKGGDADCDHKNHRDGAGRADGVVDDRGQRSRDGVGSMGGDCKRCGATRIDQQIGLERTPAEYLDRMVGVFREVWRVLRDDGTLWLNMGDCYATGAGAVGKCPGGGERGARWAGDVDRLRDAKRGYRGERLDNGRGDQAAELRKKTRADRDGTHAGKHTAMSAMGPMTQPNRMPLPGLKPKDLVGMPWRLALALQADGWYLRSDIIWHKPNPMPESVTDRPTKSHEYIFLLTKSERYYYDAEAIKEDVTGGAHARGDGVNPKAAAHNNSRTQRSLPSHKSNPTEKVNGIRPRYKMPDGWDTGPGGHGSFHRKGREKGRSPKDNGREEQGLKVSDRFGRGSGWRNKQNESFSGSVNELVDSRNKRSVWTVATQAFPEAHFATFPEELIQPCILAGCPVGGTVLDPFSGSGTTGVVALRYHRDFLGIELNPEYAKMARRRITQDAPLFNTQESS